MAGQVVTVKIEGLRDFQRAVSKAEGENPKAMQDALKDVGNFLAPKIRPPRATGELAGSKGTPRATMKKGYIPIKAKHSAPVEFSKRGAAAQTLTAKYGPPPRYGYREVADNLSQLETMIEERIVEVAKANGWFK
jgi:hypothetical protein